MKLLHFVQPALRRDFGIWEGGFNPGNQSATNNAQVQGGFNPGNQPAANNAQVQGGFNPVNFQLQGGLPFHQCVVICLVYFKFKLKDRSIAINV